MKKKIVVLTIDNEKLFIEKESWSNNDLNGRDLYKIINVGDAVPNDYTDSSNIESWEKFQRFNILNRDFIFVKDQIKILSDEIGFDNLSNNEKTISAKLKIGTHTQRLNHVGLIEYMKMNQLYNKNMSQTRRVRAGIAMVYLHSLIPENSQDIVEVILKNNLMESYINFGVKGTEYNDTEGTMDYLYGVSGTGYENKGLIDYNGASTNWNTIGSITDIVNGTKSILIDGEYDFSPSMIS